MSAPTTGLAGRSTADRPVRVGVHGRLGSGNLGNDATFEVLLDHLRRRHPAVEVDAMVSGPETLERRYRVPSRQLHWLHAEQSGWRRLPPVRLVRVGWGVVADAWRHLRWVRGHDVVLVPGMGSLETTLPVRPWQSPWALFVLGVAGRLTGTRVAHVAVGASAMPPGANRWLLVAAARLATYRSFRDEYSRERMSELGVDVHADRVYPDLVFGLTRSVADRTPLGARSAGTVGVGVIALPGGHHPDDPSGAVGYHRLVTDLVLGMLDEGRHVRLLVGDADDEVVARALMAEARASRPDLPPGTIRFEPATTLAQLADQLDEVDLVVASRFHNVVCAVLAGKPTVALGYADKHRVLMEDLGTPELARDLRGASLRDLVALVADLEARADEVRSTWRRRTERMAALVRRQLEDVDALVAASAEPAPSLGRAS